MRQTVAFNRSTAVELLVRLACRSIDLTLLVALNSGARIRILDTLSAYVEPLMGFVAVGANFEREALAMSESIDEPREFLTQLGIAASPVDHHASSHK